MARLDVDVPAWAAHDANARDGTLALGILERQVQILNLGALGLPSATLNLANIAGRVENLCNLQFYF